MEIKSMVDRDRCFKPSVPSARPSLRSYNVKLDDGEPYTENIHSVQVDAMSVEDALAKALERKGSAFKGTIRAEITVYMQVKVKAVKVDWAETDANGNEIPEGKVTRRSSEATEAYRQLVTDAYDPSEGNRG